MSRPSTIAPTDLVLWAIGSVAGLFLLTMGLALTFATEPPPERHAAPAPAYRLTVSDDGRAVHLEGRIDFGVSRDLEALLRQRNDLAVIHLTSVGGRVAEARGLVGLVEAARLSTRAVEECSSACTLVFISGERRYLEAGARLGFHRYGLHSPLVGHFLDPSVEQEKDMALFRRRAVDEAFMARIAATAHETMWFPPPAELLAAGVVDEVVRPD